MVWYTFGTRAVYDAEPGASDKLVAGATGGKLVAVKDGPAIPVRDLNGTPLSEITSNSDGQSQSFQAEVFYGLMQFGDVVVEAWAVEVASKLMAVDAAVSSAAASAASAAASKAALDAYIAATPGLSPTAIDQRIADYLTAHPPSGGGSSNTYRGAVATQTAMLALSTAVKGDWCIRTDLGQRFDLTGTNPTTVANWTPIPAVVSVAGGLAKSYDPATGGLTITAAGLVIAGLLRPYRIVTATIPSTRPTTASDVAIDWIFTGVSASASAAAIAAILGPNDTYWCTDV